MTSYRSCSLYEVEKGGGGGVLKKEQEDTPLFVAQVNVSFNRGARQAGGAGVKKVTLHQNTCCSSVLFTSRLLLSVTHTNVMHSAATH